MAFRLYTRFVEQMFVAGFLGTDSLPAIWATEDDPQLVLVPIKSGYVFDPSHDPGALYGGPDYVDWANAVYLHPGGADASKVRFDNGILWIDSVAMPEVGLAYEGTAVGFALYLNYADTWDCFIGYWDTFLGSPFDFVDGDVPRLSFVAGLNGVFDFFGCTTATAGLYPKFVEYMLATVIGGSARNEALPADVSLWVDLLTSSAEYRWAHRTDSAFPYSSTGQANWFAQAGTGSWSGSYLSGVTVSRSGSRVWLDADDAAYSSASGVGIAEKIYMEGDDGVDESLSFLRLFGHLDEGIPLIGQNVTLQWASEYPFVFGVEV